jgi:hypothetical protein
VEEGGAEREEVRRAALEFMVSLSEARPGMVKRAPGWVGAVVRGCLEGMGEFEDDEDSLEIWLEADVSVSTFLFLAEWMGFGC